MTAPAASPVTERWIAGDTRRQAPGAVVRLFCFAHAGGGAAFFFPWRRALGPRVDVRPVVLPGRESRSREPPFRRLEALLDPLCAAIGPHVDRPYALFGHSMGAVVAYEVARRLAGASPGPPVLLAVSGRRAPRAPRTRREFSGLDDRAFLAALAALNGTPAELLEDAALLEAMLPTLRADIELNERYERLPGPPLACPIAAYAGSSDTEVDLDELLRWREETSGPFTLRAFSGDHFYLKAGRPDVVAALRRDLAPGCGG